eukprot:g11110.t1
MSEHFRRIIKREPPPHQAIKFRCAKLHRVTDGHESSSHYNTIYDELKQDWHIFWADKDWIHSELEKVHLEPHQRVNHFRNHYELTRKDLLAKNVKRYRRTLEREGTAASLELAKKYEEMIPSTFVLPQEYSLFLEEFKRCGKQVLRRTDHVVWIMKPVGRSQGTGIFMVTIKG